MVRISLPSLVNSISVPIGSVPSSTLVHSHLPTISLALSPFVSFLSANDAARQTSAPTASSRAAFIWTSFLGKGAGSLLPRKFDRVADRVGDVQRCRVQLGDRDRHR